MVTAAEVNEILAEQKVIGVNLSWRRDGRSYRLEGTVLATESRTTLRLVGTVGVKNRSFVLLYKNYPIRKYTVHNLHRDPVTREIIRQPHKHWWDDEWQDRRVYIPNDIRIGDPHDELMDFLKECNIELRSPYSRTEPFTQIPLFNV